MSVVVLLSFLLLSQVSRAQVVFPGGISTGSGGDPFFPGNNISVAIQTSRTIADES
jgi:hypothetical protein